VVSFERWIIAMRTIPKLGGILERGLTLEVVDCSEKLLVCEFDQPLQRQCSEVFQR